MALVSIVPQKGQNHILLNPTLGMLPLQVYSQLVWSSACWSPGIRGLGNGLCRDAAAGTSAQGVEGRVQGLEGRIAAI